MTTLVCGGIALVTSVFAFRLQGGYFAIGTWVIAEVFRIVVSNTKELGAGTGVTIQAAVRMVPADRQALTYWLALAVGAGSIVLAAFIMRSRLGLALQAVRDNEVAARSLGVDVYRAKLAIYLVAAMGCAAAGAVIYLQLLRIQPNSAFGVDWTAKMIFIVIIGGLGRIEGPVLGTIVFFALQESLADYGSLYLIILGIVAITITVLAPQGLWGLVTRIPADGPVRDPAPPGAWTRSFHPGAVSRGRWLMDPTAHPVRVTRGRRRPAPRPCLSGRRRRSA